MTTPLEGSATTEPTAPAGSGTAPITPPTTAALSMTREELDRQLAEARRAGERTARESDEVKVLRAAKKKLDELEASQQSEAEREKKRADTAEALAAENATKYRSALIRSSFTTAAITANIPADRVDAALKLADMTGVDVGDDSTVSGMDKAIKSLPAWLSTVETPPANGQRRAAPNINAGEQNRDGAGVSREAAIEMEKQRLARTGSYT